jgi:hypothetical protein
MGTTLVLLDSNGRFGCPSTGTPVYPAVADLLAQLNRLGVTRSVVWNVESRESNCLWSNHRLLEEIEKTPGAQGRLIPMLTISPTMLYERGALTDLKKSMKRHQTRALRFTRGLTSFTLRQIEPVIQEVKSFKPVLFIKHGETNDGDILDFAQTFPEISVIVTEVGWGYYVPVFDLMRQRKNILIETSWLHTWEPIEMMIEEFGAKRIVFGLGEKAHNGASIAALARAKISNKDRELIAHGNLERLLGLKPVVPGHHQTPTIQNQLWRRLLNEEVIGEELICGPEERQGERPAERGGRRRRQGRARQWHRREHFELAVLR